MNWQSVECITSRYIVGSTQLEWQVCISKSKMPTEIFIVAMSLYTFDGVILVSQEEFLENHQIDDESQEWQQYLYWILLINGGWMDHLTFEYTIESK